MKIILTIVSVLAAGWLFLRFKISQIASQLPEEDLEENPNAWEENEREIAESQAMLQKLVVYRTLRDSVREGMTLDELIDAFEKMCQIPVGDPDDLLFETGTYDFTGEKLFYFSLVRQFQFMDEDEYVQLHLDICYAPGARTFGLRSTHWGSLSGEDFFAHVRESTAYRTINGLPMARVDVRIDET